MARASEGTPLLAAPATITRLERVEEIAGGLGVGTSRRKVDAQALL